MQNIPVSEGQTLLDIAMQYCGDVSKAMEVALLNGLNLTDDLQVGGWLMVPDVEPEKRLIVEKLKAEKVQPASLDFIQTTTSDDGIDYWSIEEDFIVQ